MFLMEPERSIIERIHFCDPCFMRMDVDKWGKEFYKFPDRVVIPVEAQENTRLPDLFLKPLPMVSEMMMEVMRFYQIEPFFRRVNLTDQNKKESERYFLIYMKEPEAVLFHDFVLKRMDHTLCCHISLDFAESILRRGAYGISLQEL